ncbi:OCIA domain-containing protein 1-like [Contarinia nasturtii]|uniref:OCIA domain-containing protein 1-like n=1 Tax=Contarinia nasturtii TaxID=265458 RepID=UPI0012D4B64C|nr:OCIA domain-containing protein 1-like [Contarinia nasturtii]
MSDRNAYQPNVNQQYDQYAQHDQPQQPVDPRREFLNYEYSPEELRAIRECGSEAFYYRSLPFSLGIGTTVYMAVKNGYLKPHRTLGPWPKVLALGFVGYIAGRVSYLGACKEKLMALPNSKLAEMLRRNAGSGGGKNWEGGVMRDAAAATALSLAPFKSVPASGYSDDYYQSSSLNLDTSRPNYSGLDDAFQPTMEGKNDLNEELKIPTRKNTVTYDELRQKNRDEFARTQNQPQPPPKAYYNQGTPVAAPPHGPMNPPAGAYSQALDSDRRRMSRARSEDDTGNEKTGPKNKYGDTWSE